MAKIRNEELDQLAGEVLPERTVLGAMPKHPGSGLLNLCNHVNQGQNVTGNAIAIVVSLDQCGLSNKGSAGGLGMLGL